MSISCTISTFFLANDAKKTEICDIKMISNYTAMISLKFMIFLCIFLMLLFIASAIYLLTGNGDWMINNYHNLPEERRARVNIFRLRKVTAGMLVFLAAMIPFDFFVQSERLQCVFGAITIVVLVVFALVAKFWAGMPLFFNPFSKK